jgi:hypothetical protein
MALYSPQFVAGVRHDYENTDKTLAQIARDHGISERSVNRMRDREGWSRRSARVRDVLPAMRALQEATQLLTEGGVATASPRPPVADGAGGSLPHAPHAQAPPPWPASGEGNAPHEPSGGANAPDAQRSAIARIERLVERELSAEEAARARLGPLARTPADAERCARTLATLTQTLHALARLRSGAQPDDGLPDDDDDMPRDIDEFRRELARRIRIFVQSRTGGGVHGGASPDGPADGDR